jgi:hypothetical protein
VDIYVRCNIVVIRKAKLGNPERATSQSIEAKGQGCSL